MVVNVIFGQSNYQKFNAYHETKDTANMRKLLAVWEKEKAVDAEFYVCAMNYYFERSKIKENYIDYKMNNPNKEALKFIADDGKEYYLQSNTMYDDKLMSKTLTYESEGIKQFPDRLDLRFGKCFILKEIYDYKNFTGEIIDAIEYSRKNNNAWLWSEHKKREDGENFFLKTVYDYEAELYNANNDDLLNYMIEIGTKAIQYYPKEVEIISITAVAYTLLNKYDKAIEYLKMAEKLNDKDFIVLGNLAQTYKRQGDKTNAIKYYELYKKYGDKQAKKDADKALEELKQ